MIWLRRAAYAVTGILLPLILVIYGGSEIAIRRTHDLPTPKIAAFTGAADIAEGGRIAKFLGCRDCHGAGGQGFVLIDSLLLGRIVGPPLARSTANYSDGELARAIRNGLRPDGTALHVMPTYAYNNLADDDVARLIGWIRTLRPMTGDETRPFFIGPLGRTMILSGAVPSGYQPGGGQPVHRPGDIGRYIVTASCSGCHALDRDQPSHDGKQVVPALAPIGASYDPAAFRTLLRTGRGIAGRDLGIMRLVATKALYALTDEEIAAIQAYLQGVAAEQPAH